MAERGLKEVQTEMTEVEAARRKLRALLGRTMRIIKAARFQPRAENGKRHPAFKDLREYESTLRSADRHMARLKAEEAALLKESAPAADQWSEFAQ